MPWREFSEGKVSYNGVVIPYKLRRSKRRRKTLQISVDPDGVRVAVPYRTTNRIVQAFLSEKAPWILKQLTKLQDRPPPRQFFTGQTMPYLGREVHLTVQQTDSNEARLRFRQWRFFVDAPGHLEGDALREEIKRAFLEWYWPRAHDKIAEAVKARWPKMRKGRKPRIVIGNQRSLWGSCAADGTLRFTWRLVMMSPRLIDYVVVHELAHLKERNHSPAFWKVVEKALPQALLRRRELREKGRDLPL